MLKHHEVPKSWLLFWGQDTETSCYACPAACCLHSSFPPCILAALSSPLFASSYTHQPEVSLMEQHTETERGGREAGRLWGDLRGQRTRLLRKWPQGVEDEAVIWARTCRTRHCLANGIPCSILGRPGASCSRMG